MLACMTEVASAAWRDGLIEGLACGLAYAAEDDLRGPALTRALVKRFNQATPAAYHHYVQAYLHQGELYGLAPKLLSFWQWRYLAADLAEIVAAAEVLGCAPGYLEEGARAALLLDDSTPSIAPYQSLLAHAGLAEADPQFHDGLVDGYCLCWQLRHDGGLDGIEYCAEIMQHLDMFWPQDYKSYRNRCAQERLHATNAVARKADDEWPLEYGPWAAAVYALAAEVERSSAAGLPLSQRGCELRRRLRCEAGEPLPTCAWTLPKKLGQELSA